MNVLKPRITTMTEDIRQIKPGNVLIAQKFWDDELFNRSVILILEHDETGSTGILLNKSNVTFESVPLSAISNNLLFGGTYDTHRVGFILPHKNPVRKSVRISDNIYYSESHCLELQKGLFLKEAGIGNLKAFIGFTVWQAGQLEHEIEENKWWIDDFNINELYKTDTDLWEYKLLKSGNLYGLFHDIADPSLN